MVLCEEPIETRYDVIIIRLRVVSLTSDRVSKSNSFTHIRSQHSHCKHYRERLVSLIHTKTLILRETDFTCDCERCLGSLSTTPYAPAAPTLSRVSTICGFCPPTLGPITRFEKIKALKYPDKESTALRYIPITTTAKQM